MEDATDIILNLKQVPFKMHVDHTKTLHLHADKAGEVKAGDIETDADVEILEPDVHIATVGEGGSLNMELRARRGRGYVSADKNFDEELGIGWIPVDSVHSPIKKVNYTVEAARLGQTTDYDKLTVDVWTDGAIGPRDAVSLGAKLIRDHLNIFINIDEPVEQPGEPAADQPTPVANEHLDKSVEELELSVRSYNCLKNADIRTISRVGPEKRAGDAPDEELRAQVIERDQGDPGGDGAGPRHAAGAASRGAAANRAGVITMRHRVAHRKLGRTTEHRIALLRNQSEALLRHERICTTTAKAKELRPFVERLISVAKRGLAEGAGAGSRFTRAAPGRSRSRRTEKWRQSSSRRSHRGLRRVPADIRGCCGWDAVRAIRRTWRRSS